MVPNTTYFSHFITLLKNLPLVESIPIIWKQSIPTDTLDNSDHGSNFEDYDYSVSFSMSNISGHIDSTSLVSSRQSRLGQMQSRFRVESGESDANDGTPCKLYNRTNQLCFLQLCFG